MIILLYHRVADLDCDPQWLAVPPACFAEQIEALRKIGPIVPLSETLCPSTATSFAITFDDGYFDNLEAAAPILAEFRAPATVFVTAGHTDREFWWDELEAILLHDRSLPTQLSLEIDGSMRIWDLTPDPAPACARWNVTQPPPSSRHALYAQLCGLLRSLSFDNQNKLLQKLSIWAGHRRSTRPTHRRMTDDELRDLSARPLMEIAAHTMTHPVLSAMDAATQETEIGGSKRRLESITNKPVTSFSYPFGLRGDFDDTTARSVRDTGFSISCANFPGLARPEVRWALPRYLVRDWPADELAERVREWQG
ncbi:MAG TPA: polysaccharide deacetylase family protein [Phycisphaerae bacterium]|nr:polysaccharide deacetylase family protein [Phycisphaerae bacterium]